MSELQDRFIAAVKKQTEIDSETEFLQTLADVRKTGANAGVSGFIYYEETNHFFVENKELIKEVIDNELENYECKTKEDFISSFNCLKDSFNNEREKYKAITITMYSENPETEITNGIAWWALEYAATLFAE